MELGLSTFVLGNCLVELGIFLVRNVVILFNFGRDFPLEIAGQLTQGLLVHNGHEAFDQFELGCGYVHGWWILYGKVNTPCPSTGLA